MFNLLTKYAGTVGHLNGGADLARGVAAGLVRGRDVQSLGQHGGTPAVHANNTV